MEIQKITPKIEHSKQRSQIFSNNINGAGTNVAQTSFTGAADTLYSIPAVFLRFLGMYLGILYSFDLSDFVLH